MYISFQRRERKEMDTRGKICCQETQDGYFKKHVILVKPSLKILKYKNKQFLKDKRVKKN
jgi:hypothetical protein